MRACCLCWKVEHGVTGHASSPCLFDQVSEERVHRLAHPLGVKLNAQQRAVLVFDSFDDAVGGGGHYAKAGSRRRNGLNVACIDLDFVLPEQGLEVRALLGTDRVRVSIQDGGNWIATAQFGLNSTFPRTSATSPPELQLTSRSG